MNHYQILGVSENASDKEIKQAYRDLAKKWHPDVCKGNKTVAKQKFSDINKAWEILKDKIKRENYNRQLQIENLTKANPATKTNGNAIANMFAPYADDMSESSMGDDSDSPIKDHADFIRKFKALKREMRATGQLSGSETESEEYIDPRAEEKKRYNDFIEKMKNTGMDSDPRVYVTLEEMYMGVTKKTRVKRRTGEFSEKEDFITVTVRPNAFEGDIVKVPGGGHFINFQNEPVKTPGDAMVCVTQIKHQVYERKFFDLHGTIDISVSEAENGFTRAVKGVDGEDIVITVPKLKRSDHIHKIYNKGMKRDIDGSRGHVYFGFVIVFDKNKDLEGENKSEGPKPDDKKKIEDKKKQEKQELEMKKQEIDRLEKEIADKKKKLAKKDELDDDTKEKSNDDEQSNESEKIVLKKDKKKINESKGKDNKKLTEKPKRGRPKRNGD